MCVGVEYAPALALAVLPLHRRLDLSAPFGQRHDEHLESGVHADTPLPSIHGPHTAWLLK